MTIAEALISSTVYPIPDNTIEKICIDRELTPANDYDLVVSVSENYELAYADLLVWIHDAPNLVEQEVGINNVIAIKRDMLERANDIYDKYDDDKFQGETYGFIGEDLNG